MPLLPLSSVHLASGAAGARQAVDQTVVMFVTIALLLGLFVALLIVVALRRFSQRPRRPAPPTVETADPWKESARRLHVEPRPRRSGENQ